MKEKQNPYLRPAFLICVCVLAVAALGMNATVKFFGVHMTKKALPLRTAMENFADEDLGVYEVLHSSRIENKDVLEELGTEDYIQIVMQDKTESSTSPVRFCSLFVTYYTGNPDMVPHVPDECYIGGGNQLAASPQQVTVKLDPQKYAPDSQSLQDYKAPEEISARLLDFTSTSGSAIGTSSFSVMYFFKVNGKYSSGRTETRKIMATNLFSKYSFFSKVEWKFYGMDYTGSMVFAEKEQMIDAAGKMLSIVLPLLDQKYWPDWEKANAQHQQD